LSRTVLVVILALALESCWWKRAPAPPQPSVNPRPLTLPEPSPLPEPILAPPTVAEGQGDPAQIPIQAAPEILAPAPRRRRGEVAKKKPAAPQVQPVPAPATVPRLGEILSPEIRANYERDFTVHVARAQDVILQASGRKLDSGQEQTVARIQGFLAQAASLREGGDLSNAVELARRASLLAGDLARTFR
jgi:hypothetical protein